MMIYPENKMKNIHSKVNINDTVIIEGSKLTLTEANPTIRATTSESM